MYAFINRIYATYIIWVLVRSSFMKSALFWSFISVYPYISGVSLFIIAVFNLFSFYQTCEQISVSFKFVTTWYWRVSGTAQGYCISLFLVSRLWSLCTYFRVHPNKPHGILSTFCSRNWCSFLIKKNKNGDNSLLLFRSLLLRATQAHMRKRVMICFRSIFYTMMHFGRHTSAGHVWNNGCHNCPVKLINLPSPSNQSVSPLANTGYIPALNERPSFTVAQKGGSRMVMSLLHEAARSNSTKRLPKDVFKSMTARLSMENVTESWCVVKPV